MNGFLVDTNVISEILRTAPEAHVAAWSQRTAKQLLFLSVVSMGELRKGVTILPASARRTQLAIILVKTAYVEKTETG